MSNKIDVLAIDDDKFIHKVLAKALNSENTQVRAALNGQLGIEMANQATPDIILLDVEMPGINGYETCELLRESPVTKDIPIVFLSSRSSLRERMQGYEAGADDYLLKPFENENLQARINILLKFRAEKTELEERYQQAQETAITALTGISELGLAMQFLEKSISYNTVDKLIDGLFEGTNAFKLDCCAMVQSGRGFTWHTSKEVISPIEKELLEMTDRESRIVDFGQRTIVNFPMISMLVRNMPLNDLELYGRIKDLLPLLLSTVNVRLNSIETLAALSQQSEVMLNSFKNIRYNLYQMGTTIVSNRSDGQNMTSSLIQALQSDLLTMGLEEDQEDYLIERIDDVTNEILEKLDAGAEIRSVLSFVLANLMSLIDNQENILDEYNKNLASRSVDDAEGINDGIELF